MRSDVLRIDKGVTDLDAMLAESEKVAVYNGLDHKQALHLRLLCEELDGMLPELIGDFEGKFFIEFEEKVCRINVSVVVSELNPQRKEDLINIAKNRKNEAAKGIVGRIRAAVEDVFLGVDLAEAFSVPMGGIDGISSRDMETIYSEYWSLSQTKNSVGENTEVWDELEKSVIASVADDVIVGIRGNQADVVIIKKFA